MEGGNSSNWHSSALYLTIVLLGLILAFIAGSYKGITLDKEGAVVNAKLNDCQEKVTKCMAEASEYKNTRDQMQQLQRECEVDRTKWEVCKQKTRECINETNEWAKKMTEMENEHSQLRNDHVKLLIECKKNETYLEVKNDEEEKNLQIKKDYDKNMQDMKVVEGGLKQKKQDLEARISELEQLNSKKDAKISELERQIRMVIEAHENQEAEKSDRASESDKDDV